MSTDGAYISAMLGGPSEYGDVKDMDEPYRSMLMRKPNNAFVIIASLGFFLSLVVDLANINPTVSKLAYMSSSVLFMSALMREWIEISWYVNMTTAAPRGVRDHPTFKYNLSSLWKKSFVLQAALTVSLICFMFIQLGIHRDEGPVTYVKNGIEVAYENSEIAGVGEPLLPVRDPLG